MMTSLENARLCPEKSSVRGLLLSRPKFNDESIKTPTSVLQIETEALIDKCYEKLDRKGELIVNPNFPELHKNSTINYLLRDLLGSKIRFELFDCNRAWLCYWIIHSLHLLGTELDDASKSRVVKFIGTLQNESGGFGGGPGQFSHLAPTYAAVNALCIIGTEEAFSVINRKTLVEFLYAIRVGDGSFCTHIGGEVDMRSVYCALSVAKLTNTYSDDLFKFSAEWIIRCQTYEGGLAGVPGMEAHGGYTFCGIAALYLLSALDLCDMKALLRWLVNRQMSYEGGFQGRTNKLVDSCYSFWQAGGIAVINMVLLANEHEKKFLDPNSWLFDNNLLQEYVLLCCQADGGGLIDKPLKSKDAYHTCYALSGLSLAQNMPSGFRHSIGSDENFLESVHPAYNIPAKKLIDCRKYFYSLPN